MLAPCSSSISKVKNGSKHWLGWLFFAPGFLFRLRDRSKVARKKQFRWKMKENKKFFSLSLLFYSEARKNWVMPQQEFPAVLDRWRAAFLLLISNWWHETLFFEAAVLKSTIKTCRATSRPYRQWSATERPLDPRITLQSVLWICSEK